MIAFADDCLCGAPLGDAADGRCDDCAQLDDGRIGYLLDPGAPRWLRFGVRSMLHAEACAERARAAPSARAAQTQTAAAAWALQRAGYAAAEHDARIARRWLREAAELHDAAARLHARAYGLPVTGSAAAAALRAFADRLQDHAIAS